MIVTAPSSAKTEGRIPRIRIPRGISFNPSLIQEYTRLQESAIQYHRTGVTVVEEPVARSTVITEADVLDAIEGLENRIPF